MSTSYKIAAKFYDEANDETRSLTINNANSGVTKAQVQTFGAEYKAATGDDFELSNASLVATTTTDLLID